MNERTFRAADAHKLDEPERLQWLPPDAVMDRLSLSQGMSVADIGAGTGYFAIPFASRIGSEGMLYAVDVQEEMLAKLQQKLSVPGMPPNITPVSGDAARTHLNGSSIDVAFLANIWHELDSHGAVLDEMQRILRPGGRLAILDWRQDLAPPPGPPAAHRIPPGDVLKTLADRRWTVQHSGPVGRYSYLISAVPPER